MKIKGYTRSDGVKVRGHNRVGTKSKRKYTPAQRRALEHSRYSKSGHKPYKQRMKQKNPGLWANTWAKRHREGKA